MPTENIDIAQIKHVAKAISKPVALRCHHLPLARPLNAQNHGWQSVKELICFVKAQRAATLMFQLVAKRGQDAPH